ncbi:MAG: hypothetical protein AABZ60_24710 [Planctomycetota bacterium]
MASKWNLLFFFFFTLNLFSGCNLFTYNARERIVGTWNSTYTEDGVTNTLTETYLKDNRYFSQMVIQGGPRKIESREDEGTWRITNGKFLHIETETSDEEEADEDEDEDEDFYVFKTEEEADEDEEVVEIEEEVFEIELITSYRLHLRSTETGNLYVYER